MKKRVRNFAVHILLAMLLLLAMPKAAFAVDNYGIIVGGTPITSANYGDVFGDGTVSYQRYVNYGKLTLKENAQITDVYTDENGKAAAIYAASGALPLRIEVKDSATIDLRGQSGICYGIYTENVPLTILQGSIKDNLTIYMPNGIGIRSGGDFRMDAGGSTVDIRTAEGSADTYGLWIDENSSFTLAGGTLDISGAQTPIRAALPGEEKQYVYRGVDSTGEETDITAAALGSSAYSGVILQPIFPDSKLYGYVFKAFDTDGDGRLSGAELAAVETLDIRKTAGVGVVTNAEGIRYFPKLKNLYCSSNLSNSVTELDVSHNPQLEVLYCDHNSLTKLDMSHNPQLKELRCEYNQLTELNLDGCTKLSDLNCSSEKLTVLDVSTCGELIRLDCSRNLLRTLDVHSNGKMEELRCEYNQLMALDVSSCPQLTYLDCRSEPLSALDVSRNTALQSLYCDDNKLETLDASKCPQLEVLHCSSNALTVLNISDNQMLSDLHCYDNRLTQLDISATPIAASEDMTAYTAYVGDQKNGGVITVYTAAERAENFRQYKDDAVISKHNNKVQVVQKVVLPGDINGDGRYTNADLTELVRYVARISTGINTFRADVNGDKHVDAADITELAQRLS